MDTYTGKVRLKKQKDQSAIK